MSRTKARAALMRELETAMRKASAQGTIFAASVAERAGISSSDMDCMDFLNLEGRMTAGRLAEPVTAIRLPELPKGRAAARSRQPLVFHGGDSIRSFSKDAMRALPYSNGKLEVAQQYDPRGSPYRGLSPRDYGKTGESPGR